LREEEMKNQEKFSGLNFCDRINFGLIFVRKFETAYCGLMNLILANENGFHFQKGIFLSGRIRKTFNSNKVNKIQLYPEKERILSFLKENMLVSQKIY
jgi:hypothetical protein